MSVVESEMDEQGPVSAWCDDEALQVKLADGRKIATPLWWYPTLLAATPEQRNQIELSPYGVHWPALDEDLSIEGMLKGRRYPNAQPPAVAAE